MNMHVRGFSFSDKDYQPFYTSQGMDKPYAGTEKDFLAFIESEGEIVREMKRDYKSITLVVTDGTTEKDVILTEIELLKN